MNQTPRDLQITTWDKSKDGKDRKDHVVQNFWYKSKISRSAIKFFPGAHLFMISTKDDFSPKNIKILSIDFETRQIREDDNNITRNQIFAAGFYSNTGFKEAIHLEDSKFNNDEVKFIRYIVYKIQSFQGIITGWYLANSDLVILDEVCKCIGVDHQLDSMKYLLLLLRSIGMKIDMTMKMIVRTWETLLKIQAVKSYPYLKDKKIIDMYKVFHHSFIKNSVYPLGIEIYS